MRFEKPTSHITIRLQSASATSVQVCVTLMETYLLFHQPKTIEIMAVSILTVFIVLKTVSFFFFERMEGF